MDNVFCTQCGAKLSPGVVFCTDCGAKAPAVPFAFGGEAINDGDFELPEGFDLPEPEEIEPAAPIIPPPAEQAAPAAPIIPPFAEQAAPAAPIIQPPAEQAAPAAPIIPPPADTEFDIKNAEPFLAEERVGGDFSREPGVLPVKPPSGAAKFFTAVFSVFLSVILFAALTCAQASVIIRLTFSENTVKNMVKGVDFANISVEADIRGVDLDGGETLSEAIYKSIDEYYTETFDISEGDIEEMLESDLLKDFLAEIISKNGDYLLGGEGNATIVSADDIVNFLDENRDEIRDMTGYTLVASDLTDIRKALEDGLGGGGLSWDDVTRDISVGLGIIRSALSIYALIIIAVLAALIITLIILINRRLTAALIYCGVTAAVSGGCVAASRFFAGYAYSGVAEAVGVDKSAVSSALAPAWNAVLLTGGAAFALGALLTIISVAVRLSKKNKGAVPPSP
ncbi:MAG: zinc ribbon domain-containing protein [Oscillospiraceae bacterium]|nr:zinc ribbon domain-containing protein [Oscillospiraceae bacterium]